jgi:hypothetical protein
MNHSGVTKPLTWEYSLLHSKIDTFSFNYQRSFHHLRMNRTNVFSDQAKEEKLNRRHEEDPDHERRLTDGKAGPEEQFVYKVYRSYE